MVNFAPSFVYCTKKADDYEPKSEAPIHSSSSTETLYPPDLIPASPSLAETPIIPVSQFELYLEEAATAPDPFVALTKYCTQKEGYWSILFKQDDNTHIECHLAFDTWSSTCFAESRPGTFRYIDAFEYDPETKTQDTTLIVSIRISEDHKEGEWMWVNRSKHVAGKQACSLGEKLSRAMRIQTCYLADTAKVKSSDGTKDISILAPLQIINGQGYYAPLFSLVDTKRARIKSPITIPGSSECVTFCQNVIRHQKDLKWLQSLQITTIYSNILKDRPQDQKTFTSLLKATIPDLKKSKDKISTVITTYDCTLQKLLGMLYTTKGQCPKALSNYEWVYHSLLETSPEKLTTKTQKLFAEVCYNLFNNVLMSARFGK